MKGSENMKYKTYNLIDNFMILLKDENVRSLINNITLYPILNQSSVKSS